MLGPQETVAGGITDVGMLVLIGAVLEPLLAGTDRHPLEVVAAAQALTQAHAFTIDHEARLALNQPAHRYRQGFTPGPKLIRRRRPSQHAVRLEVVKGRRLKYLVPLLTGRVTPN